MPRFQKELGGLDMGNKEITDKNAKQFFRELAKLMDKHKMSFFRCCYNKPIGFERGDDEYYFMYLDEYFKQVEEG
jgi:hypothetical protein